MNNITYTITDTLTSDNSSSNSWNDVPLTPITDNRLTDDVDATIIDNEFVARQMDYELNYNIKYLIQILEFYGFKKGKMNKNAIILKIVNFEIENSNKSIIENRKRLFDNFIELKNDPFFSKFILDKFI